MIEATKILDSELRDLTFNGPSEIYTTSEAEAINAISEEAAMIDGSRGESEGFSPDMINEYDVHHTPSAFAQAIGACEAQCNHESSIGSVFTARSIGESSPFIEENLASINTVTSNAKGVNANHLSKIWKNDKEIADQTIRCTTQLKKQDMEGDISRNFSTNDRMLRYKRIDAHFFTDTFQAKM